jgi:hypothetical protein
LLRNKFDDRYGIQAPHPAVFPRVSEWQGPTLRASAQSIIFPFDVENQINNDDDRKKQKV